MDVKLIFHMKSSARNYMLACRKCASLFAAVVPCAMCNGDDALVVLSDRSIQFVMVLVDNCI